MTLHSDPSVPLRPNFIVCLSLKYYLFAYTEPSSGVCGNTKDFAKPRSFTPSLPRMILCRRFGASMITTGRICGQAVARVKFAVRANDVHFLTLG